MAAVVVAERGRNNHGNGPTDESVAERATRRGQLLRVMQPFIVLNAPIVIWAPLRGRKCYKCLSFRHVLRNIDERAAMRGMTQCETET